MAYIYPVVEGTVHSSIVLAHSELVRDLPDGMHGLAEAGYLLHPKVLTLRKGCRYHFKEFGESSGKPQTDKEPFHLKHAKARSSASMVV